MPETMSVERRKSQAYGASWSWLLEAKEWKEQLQAEEIAEKKCIVATSIVA